jgi:hypothetical protein
MRRSIIQLMRQQNQAPENQFEMMPNDVLGDALASI